MAAPASAPAVKAGFLNWGEAQGFPNSQDVQAFSQGVLYGTQATLAAEILPKMSGVQQIAILYGGARSKTPSINIAAGLAFVKNPAGVAGDVSNPPWVFAEILTTTADNLSLYYKDIDGSFIDAGAASTHNVRREWVLASYANPPAGLTAASFAQIINMYSAGGIIDFTNRRWGVPTPIYQATFEAAPCPGTYVMTGTITDGSNTFGTTNSIWLVNYSGWLKDTAWFNAMVGTAITSMLPGVATYQLVHGEGSGAAFGTIYARKLSDGAWNGSFYVLGKNIYVQTAEPTNGAYGDIWYKV
jgi:hypothetical protein